MVSASLWRQRLQTRVLGIFAAMALLLAALGIYGVISYGVTQRTRELGVRMALGASAPRGGGHDHLARRSPRVDRHRHRALSAAFLLRKVVAQLVYGVAPNDPVTFIGVPLLLVAVAVVASLIPALRATKVDPAVAMRAE